MGLSLIHIFRVYSFHILMLDPTQIAQFDKSNLKPNLEYKIS